jgi:uncharacterized phage protein gp47/JayE
VAADDTLPAYLDSTLDSDSILQTMISQVPSDVDTSQGGFMWDALGPSAVQMALGAWMAQNVLQIGFAQTTFGTYLDMKVAEAGIVRNAAKAATGQLTLTGVPNAPIPAGSRFSTVGTNNISAIYFDTDTDAVIGSDGTIKVDITAEVPGSDGVVPAGSITLLGGNIDDVTGVTNENATIGGIDEEGDPSLLARYLQARQNPSAGGNIADYQRWAGEVDGVGGVSVIPVRDGPGTVSIAIIDSNKLPADQTLIDATQNYIAPPWVNTVYAQTMTQNVNGVSTDNTTTDASGNATVKMVYDAGGTGVVTNDITAILQKPGIWQARVSMKADSNAQSEDLLQIGVWSVTDSAWCPVSPSNSASAVTIFKASELSTDFTDQIINFYWDGKQDIELQVTRLQSDTTTTVWLDYSTYRSTFSQDTGIGKAPIGAIVTVEAAGTVTVNVSSQLSVEDNYDTTTVQTAAKQSMVSYLQSIAFQTNNTANYVRIGQAILDTDGVALDENLTVNGGMGNVTVGVQQVAVLGLVTWQ